MLYKKRAFIIMVLIAGLLANFWLGSRYPAIDEKAAMAGEAVLEDVLSFEARYRPEPDDPLWERVGKSTVNWTLTNRQGMTFGVLLASLVLTLLQFWPLSKGPPRTMRDILKGILIGTPLGVCVNCAAPIAFGMNRRGVRHGTSLATMFTSPSFNILVLTMMFSLLPLYMALTKVAITLLFLLLVLPLLLRFSDSAKPSAQPDVDTAAGSAGAALPVAEGWFQAVWGLAGALWRNFLFIVIRTVPLMLLAGFLGSLMANLVPLESFAGWKSGLGAMAAVAILGTFAPVPIAFDMVLIQALYVAGLPPEFTMILLVTLGMYSIYAYLIVSRMLSVRFASSAFVAVAALGLGSGYFAGAFDDFLNQRNAAIFQAQFAGPRADEAQALPDRAARPGEPPGQAENFRTGHPDTGGERVYSTDGLAVESFAFQARSDRGETLFDQRTGLSWGLPTDKPKLMDLMLPFSQGRGIASGDFDDDGWTDLAVATHRGVELYRNQHGERFEAVPLRMPVDSGVNSLLVAFADLNNDGCLDLFLGAFGANDYILVNDCQGLKSARWVPLPKQQGLMTQAASLADTDRDGDLDLLVGNWFFLIPRTAPSPRNVNYMVENRGNLDFESRPLDEIHGATLSVLLSDFNGDGLTDRIVGNDYQEPDAFYLGQGAAGFEPVPAGGMIPESGLATMSIDTGDIDNDLDMDIFLSGKVNDFSQVRHREGSLQERRRFVLQRRKAFEQDYCALFTDPVDARACELQFQYQQLMRGTSLSPCRKLATRAQQDECMVTLQVKNSLIRRDWSFCSRIPAAIFPIHSEVCEAYADFSATALANDPGYQYLDQGAIPQQSQGNVLLVQQADGHFASLAGEFGVADGHWAWTARFADLDQDGWQDLYLVNGWWLESSLYSNNFFHNRQGKGFDSRAEEFGLQSDLKQHAFTLLDIDRDGDLDIVTRSSAGDMQVRLNGEQANHSIMFEFRDHVANRFGVGNRVTIYYGPDGEQHQIREIKAGGGFVSFDAPVAHFGLGAAETVDRVVIDWSDGSQSEVPGPLAAGHLYRVHREPPITD